MSISPAYEKEYRDWIERGRFDEIYGYAAQKLPGALKQGHPALIAGHLHSMATSYYTRGTVTLLNQDPAGWQDVQAGYWTAVYALLFEYKAATLPAWSQGRSFPAGKQVEAVMTLGFARLFQQDSDAAALASLIGPAFDVEAALGNKILSGRKMLQSILDPSQSFSPAELAKDRSECCQKRDAWPKRPTEDRPFGVIDIEVMLRYPGQASFQYAPSMSFNPNEDALLIEAVTAYHSSYES